MANILGTLTINETKFVELDANPLLSPTLGLGVGDFAIIDGIPGIWHKVGAGDYDIVRIDALASQSTQATATGTLTLGYSSNNVQVFTGTAPGQVVQMPDATGMPVSSRYEFWNVSTQDIAIQDFTGGALLVVRAGELGIFILNDKSTSAGVWRQVAVPSATEISYGVPVTIGTTNAEGTASTLSRSDHVHAHGDQPGGTLHALATDLVPGFMSEVDKTKLDGLVTKSGLALAGDFTGSPKKATVTFANPFPTNNYTVNITGTDVRAWSIESKTQSSFVINANASSPIISVVGWQAQLDGEVG